MTKEEVNAYRRNWQFQRNEAIYILHKVDSMTAEDLAEAWSLSIDEIKKTIQVHSEYWEATEIETTA